MENKYYTPSIEDLYVGFECETIEGQKITIDKECLKLLLVGELYKENPKYDCITHKVGDGSIIMSALRLDINHLRVKYLDREDIESLGFKKEEVDFGELDLKINKNDCDVFLKDDLYIRIRYDNYNAYNNIVIYNECNNILFVGYIKNKSELNKLLKQIRVGE